ncbi:MAG: D-glycero-beta-D-manno-heptose 1,7-bisphosphate 7-phosphatase [Gammaproteobacteria bacterium]|jgi:D-glycero-D-manno-heptose 1,7-bisphosphate phosphatase
MSFCLVILDRDGVINADSAEFIKSAAEWHAIPGSLEAIAKLNKAGYKVAVATNQSGLGRGYFTKETLDSIHDKMQRDLASVGGQLDGIFICPHVAADNCECRKPKPGLLRKISEHFNIPKSEIISIGDSLRDAKASEAFGARFILVLTGNGLKTLQENPWLQKKSLAILPNLAEAVDWLLTKYTL